MLHSMATKICSRFFDDKDTYPMEVYVYGTELIISCTISTALVLLTGVLTHTLFQSIIYMVCFSLIRIYTGGYHSMTYLRCNIISLLSYLAAAMLLRFAAAFISSIYVMSAGYLLTMLLALLFAPVKHPNKELTQKDKGKYKLLSLIMITLFYALCALCFYVLGISEALVIFPTCITIDAAMLVSVINNYFISRRVS